MRCLITGGSGFIGSNLVDRLLSLGHQVVVVDNFSTGIRSFLKNACSHPNFRLLEADILDPPSLAKIQNAMEGTEVVFHLAANADVRFGLEHPRKDLEQNTIATFHVLESMRVCNVKKIVFSSTGSIYGESKIIPTPEDTPFPVQTSLYGASKLACEGLIAAYCEGYKMQSWIFRFVSILGERYTHGHIFDFYKQLLKNHDQLKILGNGHQKKSYLYVQDCIDAILIAIEKSHDKVNIFNLGTDEYCEVNDSVAIICKELNLDPTLSYTGGERGWIGDNPFIFLDTKKISSLGWKPKFSIKDSVLKTLRYLKANQDNQDILTMRQQDT
ncbi:MAG: NAD-dependent epimerase/dehydratase family protein [Oligoflexia bacterium]|nr:NAD-dependent epimerase/dehydratase family protein [Oligoflexia bacterium]